MRTRALSASCSALPDEVRQFSSIKVWRIETTLINPADNAAPLQDELLSTARFCDKVLHRVAS
jgi:hypothetical protein